MKIIGAGFSRTGTYSLKRALEILDFDPCYHGEVIFQRPDHVDVWSKVATQRPDWKALFAGYKAGLDSPICFYWEEILSAFPQGKVILTVRNASDWYESFHASLYQGMIHPDRAPAEIRGALRMAKSVVLDQFFDGRFDDREHAIGVYNRHIQTVKQRLSGDDSRLLVFDVADGWSPLCRFLDRKIPFMPFPQTNSRSEFARLFS